MATSSKSAASKSTSATRGMKPDKENAMPKKDGAKEKGMAIPKPKIVRGRVLPNFSDSETQEEAMKIINYYRYEAPPPRFKRDENGKAYFSVIEDSNEAKESDEEPLERQNKYEDSSIQRQRKLRLRKDWKPLIPFVEYEAKRKEEAKKNAEPLKERSTNDAGKHDDTETREEKKQRELRLRKNYKGLVPFEEYEKKRNTEHDQQGRCSEAEIARGDQPLAPQMEDFDVSIIGGRHSREVDEEIPDDDREFQENLKRGRGNNAETVASTPISASVRATPQSAMAAKDAVANSFQLTPIQSGDCTFASDGQSEVESSAAQDDSANDADSTTGDLSATLVEEQSVVPAEEPALPEAAIIPQGPKNAALVDEIKEPPPLRRSTRPRKPKPVCRICDP